MTRKDFELIAKTVKAFPLIGKDRLALQFANALEKHSGNANFDKARFLKACGVAVKSDVQ
jgi:hypothetical protein